MDKEERAAVKPWIGYIAAIAAVVVLTSADQISKSAARVKIGLSDAGQIPIIEGVLHLTYAENRGAAFGIFQGARWLFIPLTIAVVAAIVRFFIKLPRSRNYLFVRSAMTLIVAGAIGNFIDRVKNGYVIDFIYFKLIDFPVFNVADMLVVCGAILFMIVLMFDNDRLG